ncbi:molybdopterin molybdochelatase [Anseongella ginsenosidimutans]|uniref:Molybdopterin molybdenumtransferase n=1 Tax=Anseongella ginsenosidimutans TaxID=496056 RepID=A0A4R3KXI4_9SPHI|nr:molybdopterin molybdotransferase MoeA [Anseongella ginsenosidimutans]QEC51161.1 molybdopterin molybdotransferase MoeA [Anseongella ginsenosidimutans]TCS90168.1 molybdopterin molybdochelatase [Anseongella ginsenosidimutans]
MIAVNEAFDRVMNTSPDFGKEVVPLQESAGRVLRQQVLADRDLPPFNRVCMDGIAIDSRSFLQGKRKFYRQGFLGAGEAPPGQATGPDACMEVMTGSVLPPGTDAVIPYEQLEALSEEDGTWYQLKASIFPEAGQHIHSQGSDAAKGSVLLEEGVRITSPVIAVLASAGVSMVKVSRMPRVSIVCSGDELVPVSEEPLPEQIRQSNGYAISALLRSYGVSCRIHYVRDHPGQIGALLRELKEGPDDCLISTGGVSAGRKDLIPGLLKETKGSVLFHKVAQRPGKPLLFGCWENGKVFFGLPGNPVSCMAACCRYVIPWILEGLKGKQAASLHARLSEPVNFSPKLTCFLPVRLVCDDGGMLRAYPLRGQGSGDLVSMQLAEGFIELPAEKELFSEGEAYRVWPLDGSLILP